MQNTLSRHPGPSSVWWKMRNVKATATSASLLEIVLHRREVSQQTRTRTRIAAVNPVNLRWLERLTDCRSPSHYSGISGPPLGHLSGTTCSIGIITSIQLPPRYPGQAILPRMAHPALSTMLLPFIFSVGECNGCRLTLFSCTVCLVNCVWFNELLTLV